jgi:ABC-type Fe3+/spermidine/putrescine transport system ATPase subunit
MNRQNRRLEVTELAKKWPDMQIQVSFEVASGEMLGILGHSGCGKSTLLRMIAGLLAPDGGKVTLGGSDITALPPGKRGVGMVFQDSALFPHMRTADNVAYGLVSQGMNRREALRKAEELLERFGLGGFGRRWPDSLSGGEKQRAAIARTLAVEPSVVLFDEPLSSLDIHLRQRLREEIRESQRELGFTGVMVSHDVEEIREVSDSVLVMKKGAVIWRGKPGEVDTCQF